eukprot:Opistho-1_new@100258
MNVGTKLTAPEGWDTLPKGLDVHFLRNSPKSAHVFFVHFEVRNRKSAKATLISMQRFKFEEGVDGNHIAACSLQSTLPPWLSELEGLDLSKIDLYRSSNFKKSHHDRVTGRYQFIDIAVKEFEDIINSTQPQIEIHKRARLCSPPQQETRFRLWLLAYLCFGRNIWALLPPYCNIGHWDRLEHSETKLGAPSKALGKNYGHGMSAALKAKCIKSYIKRAELGKSMTTIYQEAMAYDFKCRSVKQLNGMKIFVSTNGSQFPTYDQFRYRVHKEFGLETVQRTLYGEVRHRTRIASSKGRFSQEVANLMERVEADAYYVSERPIGLIENTTLKPLCVVVGRDILSGCLLGIGFSFGKERSTAYRMMLFSMVVPKVFFCSLFGIRISADEWMNEGMPAHLAIDRGPGARQDLIEAVEDRIPIKDVAPSWSGQSKATIESSHPRDVIIEGQPTYVDSGLNTIQLAKREIWRLINYNDSANMEDRIDPDKNMVNVIPSPNGIWQYYDQLYRNDAQPMSIEDAIRCFLTPIELTVKEDGVYLHSRRFYCQELRDTGLLDIPGITKVKGYILDMAVRFVWIEFRDRLIQTNAMLRIRGDEETLFMSLEDLQQWKDATHVLCVD